MSTTSAPAPAPAAAPARASFQWQMRQLVRQAKTLQTLDPMREHPSRQLVRKLRNAGLVAGHRVRMPRIHAVWRDHHHLDFRDLPDRFVVKSDMGSGGKGVIPLERIGRDTYQRPGEDTPMTTQDVARRLAATPEAYSPYFAEEYIDDDSESPLPDDVKIYTFFGEVGLFRVRRTGKTLGGENGRHHYFGPDGESLGKVNLDRAHSPELPRPTGWKEALKMAVHLSKAVPLPFLRVDVYASPEGPVFGEFTRAGGGRHRYPPEVDERLGRLWETAQARLDVHVAAGRPLQILRGSVEPLCLYPRGHDADPCTPGVVAQPRALMGCPDCT